MSRIDDIKERLQNDEYKVTRLKWGYVESTDESAHEDIEYLLSKLDIAEKAIVRVMKNGDDLWYDDYHNGFGEEYEALETALKQLRE